MTDVLALFTIFSGLIGIFAVPLLIVVGLPLAAWLARAWLGLREREIQLREMELVLRLRESRALPAWVDDKDPKSLLAWIRTDQELARLDPKFGKALAGPPNA